jgi:hypothetical protein
MHVLEEIENVHTQKKRSIELLQLQLQLQLQCHVIPPDLASSHTAAAVSAPVFRFFLAPCPRASTRPSIGSTLVAVNK